MKAIVLPHAEDAEMAVIGGIFYDPESFLSVKPILGVDDFYMRANQRIYAAMLDLYEDEINIDLVTVSERLKDKGELEKAGGPVYLSKIADSTPTAAHILSHAHIVREKTHTRRIVEEAQKIISSAMDPYVKPDEIPTRLAIDKGEKIEVNHVFSVTKKLNENIRNGYPGLFPGYNLLERTIRKVSPGHLWVVGGYTSVGKSAWLVDFVCRMYANSTGNPGIAIFSTEMSCEQYLIRCIGNMSGIPGWAITENSVVRHDQTDNLIRAQSHISSRNLYMYDSMYKIGDIESTARMLKEQRGLDIVAIDYLQNLWGEGTIYERMSRLAPILQYLAKDLQITIIALSQVSNQHVREKHMELHGYKGAGEIAASADLGIELQKHPIEKDVMKFLVKKNRHGKLAEGALQYVNDYTKLVEVVQRMGEYENGG